MRSTKAWKMCHSTVSRNEITTEPMFCTRIVTVDHYQSFPIKGYDMCYSDFRGCEIYKVPVIRIFGITPAGQKTCLHVHNIFPYISIPCTEELPHNEANPSFRKYTQELALSIDKAINVASIKSNSYKHHVYKISLVFGIPFYGYHESEQAFLRIYFYNPNMMTKVADLLASGAIMNKVIQPFEAHIPYILQFFINYNLFGMNLIKVKQFRFRDSSENFVAHSSPLNSPSLSTSKNTDIINKIWRMEDINSSQMCSKLKRQTHCELEADCISTDIMNKYEEQLPRGGNPGLKAIWDDERQRRRQNDEPSQITPASSQGRPNITESKTEIEYKQVLRQLLVQFQNKSAMSPSFEAMCSASALGSQVSSHSFGGDSSLCSTQDKEILSLLLSMVEEKTPDGEEDSILSIHTLCGAELDAEEAALTHEMSQCMSDDDDKITNPPASIETNQVRNLSCEFQEFPQHEDNIFQFGYDFGDNYSIPQFDGAGDDDDELKIAAKRPYFLTTPGYSSFVNGVPSVSPPIFPAGENGMASASNFDEASNWTRDAIPSTSDLYDTSPLNYHELRSRHKTVSSAAGATHDNRSRIITEIDLTEASTSPPRRCLRSSSQSARRCYSLDTSRNSENMALSSPTRPLRRSKRISSNRYRSLEPSLNAASSRSEPCFSHFLGGEGVSWALQDLQHLNMGKIGREQVILNKLSESEILKLTASMVSTDNGHLDSVAEESVAPSSPSLKMKFKLKRINTRSNDSHIVVIDKEFSASPEEIMPAQSNPVSVKLECVSSETSGGEEKNADEYNSFFDFCSPKKSSRKQIGPMSEGSAQNDHNTSTFYIPHIKSEYDVPLLEQDMKYKKTHSHRRNRRKGKGTHFSTVSSEPHPSDVQKEKISKLNLVLTRNKNDMFDCTKSVCKLSPSERLAQPGVLKKKRHKKSVSNGHSQTLSSREVSMKKFGIDDFVDDEFVPKKKRLPKLHLKLDTGDHWRKCNDQPEETTDDSLISARVSRRARRSKKKSHHKSIKIVLPRCSPVKSKSLQIDAAFFGNSKENGSSKGKYTPTENSNSKEKVSSEKNCNSKENSESVTKNLLQLCKPLSVVLPKLTEGTLHKYKVGVRNSDEQKGNEDIIINLGTSTNNLVAKLTTSLELARESDGSTKPQQIVTSNPSSSDKSDSVCSINTIKVVPQQSNNNCALSKESCVPNTQAVKAHDVMWRLSYRSPERPSSCAASARKKTSRLQRRERRTELSSSGKREQFTEVQKQEQQNTKLKSENESSSCLFPEDNEFEKSDLLEKNNSTFDKHLFFTETEPLDVKQILSTDSPSFNGLIKNVNKELSETAKPAVSSAPDCISSGHVDTKVESSCDNECNSLPSETKETFSLARSFGSLEPFIINGFDLSSESYQAHQPPEPVIGLTSVKADSPKCPLLYKQLTKEIENESLHKDLMELPPSQNRSRENNVTSVENADMLARSTQLSFYSTLDIDEDTSADQCLSSTVKKEANPTCDDCGSVKVKEEKLDLSSELFDNEVYKSNSSRRLSLSYESSGERYLGNDNHCSSTGVCDSNKKPSCEHNSVLKKTFNISDNVGNFESTNQSIESDGAPSLHLELNGSLHLSDNSIDSKFDEITQSTKILSDTFEFPSPPELKPYPTQCDIRDDVSSPRVQFIDYFQPNPNITPEAPKPYQQFSQIPSCVLSSCNVNATPSTSGSKSSRASAPSSYVHRKDVSFTNDVGCFSQTSNPSNMPIYQVPNYIKTEYENDLANTNPYSNNFAHGFRSQGNCALSDMQAISPHVYNAVPSQGNAAGSRDTGPSDTDDILSKIVKSCNINDEFCSGFNQQDDCRIIADSRFMDIAERNTPDDAVCNTNFNRGNGPPIPSCSIKYNCASLPPCRSITDALDDDQFDYLEPTKPCRQYPIPESSNNRNIIDVADNDNQNNSAFSDAPDICSFYGNESTFNMPSSFDYYPENNSPDAGIILHGTPKTCNNNVLLPPLLIDSPSESLVNRNISQKRENGTDCHMWVPETYAPPKQEALLSSEAYNIPEEKYQGPFFNDPSDPELKSCDYQFQTSPNKISELPEFEGSFQPLNRDIFREPSASLLDELRNNKCLRDMFSDNKIHALAPTRHPPSLKDVRRWLNGSASQKPKDEAIPCRVLPTQMQHTETSAHDTTTPHRKKERQGKFATLSKLLELPVTENDKFDGTDSSLLQVAVSTPQISTPIRAGKKARKCRRSQPAQSPGTHCFDDLEIRINHLKASIPLSPIVPTNTNTLSLKKRRIDFCNLSLDEAAATASRNTERRDLNNIQSNNLFSRTFNSSSSQIEGPTLENSGGFRVNVGNMEDAGVNLEKQHLTIMSIEIHVNSRSDMRPDPQLDAICAVFFCTSVDSNSQDGCPKSIGIIAVESTFTSEFSFEGMQNQRDGHLLHELQAAADVSQDLVFCVKSELLLFEKLIALVQTYDPDIILGYEIELLSLGYLLQRASRLNINLSAKLSRLIETYAEPVNKAHLDEGTSSGPNKSIDLKISGRIVLNIWRLMRKEVTLNIYTFENVFYHVLHKRTPIYTFQTLTNWYQNCQQPLKWRVLKYYTTRASGSIQLLEKLNLIQRTSELARIFGIQFYEVLSRGSQFRVESMMLRASKPQNYIPISPTVQQRSRSRAPEYVPLILEPESKFYFDPVLVLDFQSLYPSMIIAYNYCFSTCLGRVVNFEQDRPFEFGCSSLSVPIALLQKLEKDIHISPAGVAFVKSTVRKGVLPSMLEEILNTRIMVKQSLKRCKSNKALSRLLDARQLGLKLIANVTYGYTSANFSGRMPCVEVADSIVSKGRETLERAIQLIEETPKWKAKVVYGDTDSMFVLLRGRSKQQAFKIGQEIADAVTARNPPPVKLKFEKVYLPCVLQTKKHYVGNMYESLEQEEPVFDAKGIETVRRDTCPAVAKILERSLKIYFESRDISLVQKYVQKQFVKLANGRASIIDCIFAKEYRGLSGYRPTACVPALEIARKRLLKDPRSEPRVGERVPYVVIYGFPDLPIIQLIKEPGQLLQDSSLRINAKYYITRAISPALDRVFSLIGVDVKQWYASISQTCVPSLPMVPAANRARATLSQYFTALSCPACGKSTDCGLCSSCRTDPQTSSIMLADNIRQWERTSTQLSEICRSCTKTSSGGDACISVDCPILFRRNQAQKDLSQAPYLRNILLSDF